MNPITLDRPLPKKIAIVGFADSKDEAPFADASWEIWGVNDLYAHVPRVDRSFELHNLVGLGNRRNPNYEAWLKEGKTPVYMWESEPNFPSVVPFPRQEVMKHFGDYFTNSIAWMTAFALLVLTKEEADGTLVKREDGVELALFGVDMAHETEYGSQRPSCEYYIGIGRALGIPIYVPPTSDLLKASSLYGLETTSPQRIKLMKRIEQMQNQANAIQQQEAQLQAQIAHLQAQRNQIKGAIGMAKYCMGVWTMPTDNVMKTDKQRLLEPVTNGHGAIEGMLKEFDLQEVSGG